MKRRNKKKVMKKKIEDYEITKGENKMNCKLNF